MLVKSFLGVLLAFLVLAVTGGAANAQAEVERFRFEEPLPTLTSLPECLDDTVGTQVGTEVTAGQIVDTGTTFHISGTNTLTYTVTFADGRYVTGSSVEHFALNANGPLTSSTVAITESRTIFSAEGEPVGTVRIHAVSHITFEDPGEIRVVVDQFFFTCS